MKDLHRHVSSHHSFMYLWLIGAVLVFLGLGYSYLTSHPQGVLDNSHEGEVRAIVSAFGNELKAVSLFAPDASEQIARAYGPYVAPEQLSVWRESPLAAPGRKTSSPWPSHIAIDSVTKIDNEVYEVAGRVVLVTSTSDEGSIPVLLRVAVREDGYQIVSYEEGGDNPVEEQSSVTATLALNEEVRVHGVSLKVLEVVEDSRCPMDAVCIQQGTARIRVEVTDEIETRTEVLTLSSTEPLSIGAVSLWLTAVEPYPKASEPTEPSMYRFTFRAEAR